MKHKKKRDFSEIHQILLDQYHAAQGIAKMGDDFEARTVMSDDISDEAQQNEFMEVSTQLATLGSQRLKNIVEALERIRTKTYGSCDACEQDIPLARLEVLPFATHCSKCQAVIDN